MGAAARERGRAGCLNFTAVCCHGSVAARAGRCRRVGTNNARDVQNTLVEICEAPKAVAETLGHASVPGPLKARVGDAKRQIISHVHRGGGHRTRTAGQAVKRW